MNNVEKVLDIAKRKGYVTANLLKQYDIPSWFLSDMVKREMLKRVGRGVYISNQGVYDEYFVFQYRHKKAIYSYSNALYFHHLTDRIPSYLEVTVYQGYNAHRFQDNVKVHYVKEDLHELGVTEIRSPYGNMIHAYDKERCLCDLVINKQKVESEVFKKAFQTYFNHDDKDVNKLMTYATKMGIEDRMLTLTEVISP